MSPRVTPKNRIPDIMKAAIRVFGANGYRLSQMEQIAREARVSKATLYYYFRSKVHLFYYILENGLPADTANLPSPEVSASVNEEDLLRMLEKKLQAGSRLNSISRFLDRNPGEIDVSGELAEILEELWDLCERNRIQIVILEKSVWEFPELAEIYERNVRGRLLDQLAGYLDARIRLGAMLPLRSVSATARFMLESLAWFGFKQSGIASVPVYTRSETLPDMISIFARGLAS